MRALEIAMERVHAYYSGNVHGIGFRFTAVDIARRHKVSGWVKNLYDGGVEVVAEGEETVLKNFLTALKNEMSHYIHEEKFSWEPATGEFAGFQIRF